jgi:quinol monooxygenase YgiN
VIYVIATLRARPEKLSQLLDAAKAVIAGTRKEDGCIFYDLHQSVTDPDQLVFVERWSSREALAKHFEAPHMVPWRAAGAECVVERKVEIVTPEHVETR